MYRRQLIGLVVFVGLLGTAAAQAAGDGDDVAIIVNGSPIATWEIGLLMPQIQTEMTAQGLKPTGEEVLRRTLDRAIDSRLLSQEALRRGFQPDEARVERKLAAIAEGAGGRAELEAELIKSGVSYDQLRHTVFEADLVQALVEAEVMPSITVTDADVEEYYNDHPELFVGPDRIHARHILFRLDGDASESERKSARRQAERVRKLALAGEDFAELAIEYSEGPNALRGGDLGFTTRGMMVDEFDDAVWALQPGEISEVVETEMGLHVIKVEEIVPGERVPLDEARPALTDLIRQQRLAVALAEFVGTLRKSAKIEYPED